MWPTFSGQHCCLSVRYPFPSLEIKMYALCANKILVKPLDELCKDSNIVAKGKSDAAMQLYETLYFHRSCNNL